MDTRQKPLVCNVCKVNRVKTTRDKEIIRKVRGKKIKVTKVLLVCWQCAAQGFQIG